MSDSKKIMLVDDNKNLLITMGDYLAFSGFEVVVARSGEEALRKLEKTVPDLIILDISMPGMGGIGFLKHLPELVGNRRYPVLVLTARAGMEEFFTDIHVDGFLSKPCSEEKLVEKIREILMKQQIGESKAVRTKRRVLLGEDDDRVINEVMRVFGIAGYDVELASTGPDVLEKSPTIMPDAILVKEVLPRMNGGVVASLVSSMASTKAIPVILYDETRTLEEQQRYGLRVPDGVHKFLLTSRAESLLEAVQGALQG